MQEPLMLKVRMITREKDRIVLWGDSGTFHVLAKPNEQVAVGETVEYELYGVNFGWFIRKVE